MHPTVMHSYFCFEYRRFLSKTVVSFFDHGRTFQLPKRLESTSCEQEKLQVLYRGREKSRPQLSPRNLRSNEQFLLSSLLST